MANEQIKHLMLKLLGQDTEEVMDIYDEKAVHIANDVTKADISKDANSNNYKVTWYTQESPAKGRTLLLNNNGGLFRTFDYSSGSLVTNTHWELATKDKVVRKEGSLLTDAYLRKSTSETERYEIVFKTNGNTGAQLIMRDNGLVYQRFENGTYSTKWNAIPTSKIVNDLTSSDATTVLSGAQGKALRDNTPYRAASGWTTSLNCHFTNTGFVIIGTHFYVVLVQGGSRNHTLSVVKYAPGDTSTMKQQSGVAAPSVSHTQGSSTVTFKWTEANILTVTSSTNNSIAIIATE